MGQMGKYVVCEMYHGVPLYWWKSTKMKDDKSQGFEVVASKVEMNFPSAPLTRPPFTHKFLMSITFFSLHEMTFASKYSSSIVG